MGQNCRAIWDAGMLFNVSYSIRSFSRNTSAIACMASRVASGMASYAAFISSSDTSRGPAYPVNFFSYSCNASSPRSLMSCIIFFTVSETVMGGLPSAVVSLSSSIRINFQYPVSDEVRGLPILVPNERAEVLVCGIRPCELWYLRHTSLDRLMDLLWAV